MKSNNYCLARFSANCLLLQNWDSIIHTPDHEQTRRTPVPKEKQAQFKRSSITNWLSPKCSFYLFRPNRQLRTDLNFSWKKRNANLLKSCHPRSYGRNFSNCVGKPEKFRTSTGFEPVTSRYRCDTLTNWAMKPLMLGAGHLWVVIILWGVNLRTKWYVKWIIYWTADMKSSEGTCMILAVMDAIVAIA